MSQRVGVISIALLVAAVSASTRDRTQSPASAGRVDFATEIQPIFRQHCIECHGAREQKNGLRLDRRKDAMRGGTIAVIGPGNADGSRLYHRLIGDKFGIQMPPTGALPAEKIARIKAWIDQGAEWPDALAGDKPPSVPAPAVLQVTDLLRRGEFASVAARIDEAPGIVHGRGAGGATPLMLAALYGDAPSVRTLIARGADVNAANDEGATALMWAASDLEVARLLIDAGADVNARSADGRSPLLIAAGIRGAAPVVRLLLDKGADLKVRAPGLGGDTTALLQAAMVGDDETFGMLVARGADVESVAPLALGLGSRAECKTCADTALKLVGKAGFTGLLHAVLPPGDTAEAVPRLLDAGADPTGPGIDGRSTLMLAAASESAPVDAVKRLIDAGLDVNARDARGFTALAYARMHGRTPVVELLETLGAAEATPAPAPPATYRPAASVRAAISRSLPSIQHADEQFLKKSGCVSCHNNSVAAMTVSLARARKLPVNEKIASAQRRAIGEYLHTWRDRALQGIGIPGDTTTMGYILVGLAAENHPADVGTDAAARFLLAQQMKSGAWLPLASRPPIEGSTIQATAITMMALKAYAPAVQRARYDAAIARGAAWLRSQVPVTNEDVVFQLLGLECGEVELSLREKTAKALIARQHRDGGWSQLQSLSSDAYATGLALVGLAKTGMLKASDPVYRQGVRYLLRTQLADGSWHVRSRAIPIQPHFESGFPHGKDQFISAAATNWATMALLFAVGGS
jgi:ankyrin repeat protein